MIHAISAHRPTQTLPPQAHGLALGHRRAQAHAAPDMRHGPASRVTLSAEGRAMAHQAITAESGRARHGHGKAAALGQGHGNRVVQPSSSLVGGTGGALSLSASDPSETSGRRVPRGIAKKLGGALSGPSSALAMARNLSSGPASEGGPATVTGAPTHSTAAQRTAGHGRGWGHLINGTQGASGGQPAEAAAKTKPPHSAGAPDDDKDTRTMRDVLQAAARGVVTAAKLRRTADAEALAESAHSPMKAKDREAHRAYAEAPKRRDDMGGLSHTPAARALQVAASGSAVGQLALLQA